MVLPPANAGASVTIRHEATVGSRLVDPWAGGTNRECTEIKEGFE